jgi:hypothetical protein
MLNFPLTKTTQPECDVYYSPKQTYNLQPEFKTAKTAKAATRFDNPLQQPSFFTSPIVQIDLLHEPHPTTAR